MKRIVPMLAVAALLFGAEGLMAQQTVNGTATINIPTVLWLDVTGESPVFNPGEADLLAGTVPAVGSTVISHRGNVQHSLRLSSDAATLSYDDGGSGEPDPTKPVSDITFTGGLASGQALSDTDFTLRTESRGSYVGGNALTVTWQALVDFDDPPGTYTVGVVYTLVAGS